MSAIIFLEINNSNSEEIAMIIQKLSTFKLNNDGRFIIENGINELEKGVCSNRVCIIEFSSIEKAYEWCKSEEFLSLEYEKNNYRMILIDGGKSNSEIGNEITDLITNQINQIQSDRYSRIRNIYKIPYKFSELQTIKHQICICIALNLNIASMTLTNHLLEKLMKFALIYDDSKKNKKDIDFNNEFAMVQLIKKSTPKYDGKNLYDNIISAYNNKIIDENEKGKLLDMKNFFRNPYSHSNRDTLYGDSEMQITEIKGIENIAKFFEGNESELPKTNEKLVNLPFGDFTFIHGFAEKDCIPYLIDLDKIIRNIESRLIEPINLQ